MGIGLLKYLKNPANMQHIKLMDKYKKNEVAWELILILKNIHYTHGPQIVLIWLNIID